MKEVTFKNQFKSYFNSLLKASKESNINKKMQFLSDGLKKIGWQKVGIFIYSDDKELTESFVEGIDESILQNIVSFRLSPSGRQDFIKDQKKSKEFYVVWDDALKLRNMDVKKLYRKIGYSSKDNPIGILVFLRTDSQVIGSMHLIRDNKEGWEENIDVIEMYANYAAQILADYILKKQIELSNERYKAVFENSLDPIIVADKNKRITLCNRKFCELIGKKEEKLLFHQLSEIISGDTKEFDSIFENVFNEKSGDIHLKIINKKNEEIPVRIFLKPQKWGENISQAEMVIEDQRSGLDLLMRAKASERSYRLIYENSFEGIGLFTLDGYFISCNPSGLNQTGYSEKEIIGKNFDILVEDKIKPIARKIFKKAAIGNAFHGRHFNIIRKDGSIVALSISAAPIRSSENETIGVMLISRDITVEIEAKTAREKTQKEFRRILNNLEDIYYRCDKDGKIEYINPAVEKILGYKNLKYLIGKSLPDTLCVNKAMANESYKILLKDRFIYNSPFIAQKVTGESLYCEENAHLLFDENGNVIGWEGTIRDESRRRAAEQALADSVEQLETITKNLPLGVYRTTTDPEGQIIYLNPAFPKMFGYKSIEEMQKVKPLSYYYEPELRGDFLKILSREGSLNNVEYRMYKKNGDIIWISDSCFAVKDSKGEIKYIDGIMADVTFRKELEAELRESEKRYRLIAENVSDVIWILDMNLNYLYVSPSVKEMRGYSAEELVDKNICESLNDTSYEVVRKILAERMVTFANEPEEVQLMPVSLELEMNHKNGYWIWTEIRAVIIKDKNGNPYGIQGVTRDITARKRAEEALTEQLALLDEKVKERTRELAKTNEELLRSNRIKSEFLANISHELRSPLTSILGYTEMLQETPDLDTENSTYVGIIATQSNHLLHLVDSLLDIAKYESGTLKLNLSPTDINKIIIQVIEHMLLKLKKAKLLVETQLDNTIKEVNLDGQKIYQVIRNLVDNAIKFSPENKVIYIESRLVENEIQVRVKDQGIGIAEKYLSSIFDPFYQVDGSSTRYYEGAGLGLHLVKNFINMHHGRVWVESECNKGAMFTVCFPINLQRPSDVTFTPKEGLIPIHITPEEEKHKILMVDDDAEISHLVQIMLRHQYTVLTAKNGKEAVEVTKAKRPDMVLMDLSMPVLDGYEATKILKSMKETEDIPIIALSARAMKGEIEKALQVGCDAHLAKPFKLNDLTNIIKRFIK